MRIYCSRNFVYGFKGKRVTDIYMSCTSDRHLYLKAPYLKKVIKKAIIISKPPFIV